MGKLNQYYKVESMTKNEYAETSKSKLGKTAGTATTATTATTA